MMDLFFLLLLLVATTMVQHTTTAAPSASSSLATLKAAVLTSDLLDVLDRMPILPDHSASFQHNLKKQRRTSRSLQESSDSTQLCSTALGEFVSQLLEDGGSDGDLIISLVSYFGIFKATKAQRQANVDEVQTYGTNGEYTEELNVRMQQMIDFWNPSFAPQVMDLHGSDWQDQELVRAFVEYAFEPSFFVSYDDYHEEINSAIQGLDGQYNNPLLTFAALTTPKYDTCESDGNNIDTPTIVFGDSMMDFIVSQGFGIDGPDFILAHEFAHLLQFEEMKWDGDVISVAFGSSASNTRRMELEADAMAAYFMVNGGNHSIQEVDELHVTARFTGDYSFDADQHHGTPAQRECATLWGATIALNATFTNNSTIDSDWDSVQEFRSRGFDDAFGLILLGDELFECQNITVKEECGDDRVEISNAFAIGSTNGGGLGTAILVVTMGVAVLGF